MDNGTKEQKVISVTIKDKAVLYAAYMPFLKKGGLFIPTSKPYLLGQKVKLQMTLMEEPDKLVIDTAVVWITPPGAHGAPGIGLEFQGEDTFIIQQKIEFYLTGMLNSGDPTHTL